MLLYERSNQQSEFLYRIYFVFLYSGLVLTFICMCPGIYASIKILITYKDPMVKARVIMGLILPFTSFCTFAVISFREFAYWKIPGKLSLKNYGRHLRNNLRDYSISFIMLSVVSSALSVLFMFI